MKSIPTLKGIKSIRVLKLKSFIFIIAMHGSSPVKNGWRMNNKAKDNKWYIIYAKNPQEKEEWMKAFKSERERVKEDEDKGK